MRLRRHRGAIIAACALLGATSLVTTTLHAQSQGTPELYKAPVPGPAIGVHGGLHRGVVDAAYAIDALGLSTSTECGRYEHGSATGFVVGLFGELPLTHVLGIHSGLKLVSREAEMSYPCVDPAGIRMPDGSIAPATTEFHSTASYGVATLELGVAVRPLPVPLTLSVGPTLSLLSGAGYSAREVIVSPREASFVAGGGQERSIGEGEFETGGLSVGIAGTLAYEVPLGGRFWLAPRVTGTLALSDEIVAGAIRGTGVEVTLGLLYRFEAPDQTSSPIEAGRRPAEPR